MVDFGLGGHCEHATVRGVVIDKSKFFWATPPSANDRFWTWYLLVKSLLKGSGGIGHLCTVDSDNIDQDYTEGGVQNSAIFKQLLAWFLKLYAVIV